MAHARTRLVLGAVLLVLTSLAFGLVRAEPSLAATCDNSWDGGAGDGLYTSPTNWTLDHVPLSTENACIDDLVPGNYTVVLGSSTTVANLTIGGASGTQTLSVSGNFTQLRANVDATLTSHGEITLDCSVINGLFLEAGGQIANGGKITTTGTCSNPAVIQGDLVNTGTLQINTNTTYQRVGGPNVTLDNQGIIALADGVALSANSGNCGAPNAMVINGSGGQVSAAGSGTLVASDYKQGAGTTTGTAPVTIVCGFLDYTGSGQSKVLATNSFNLSGATQPGQTLTLNSPSTIITATAGSGFTNGGQLTFDCPVLGCPFGTAGAPLLLLGGGNPLINTGTITVEARASGNGRIGGNLTNTGTLQIDGNFNFTHHTEPQTTLDNQGAINIANGATFQSVNDSCGATTVSVDNNANGSINATGTGTFSSNAVYNQGAGTTTGTNPVTMSCGRVVYTGTGASTVRVSGSGILGGNPAAGQTLTLGAGVTLSAPASFSNGGTINFPASGAGDLAVPVGQTITNNGTIAVGNLSNSTIGKLANGTGGTLTLADDSTLTVSNSEPLTNQGTIGIGPSALLAAGSFSQSAGTTTLNGTASSGPARLQATGPTLTGGTLGGVGRVQGNLTNGGTISPGIGATPGTLDVTGTYTQQAGGTLNARVRQSGNDRLTVSGAASVDGTLAISTSGFTVTEGDTYTVLSGASRSGQFATVTGQSSGPYDVVYDATAVKLLALAQPTPPPGGPTGPPAGTTVSVDNPSVRNPGSGDAVLTFTVKLSQASLGIVTVNYATSDATAHAPGDYAAATGALAFSPGETEKTVAVTVHGTGSAGADRTLELDLTTPSGSSLTSGTGTILNDRLTLDEISPDGGGASAVTVVLHGAGLTGSPTVRLKREGAADIVATHVVPAADGRTLEARLDLTSAARGAWDVVAGLPTFDASATLEGGFTVTGTVPPVVRAELRGRAAALDGYPWFGRLQLTNAGNVDATNTLVRIDGFQTGADVDVIGAGASGADLESGASRSVVIAVDRVPAGSTKDVRVRFTPIGPIHSFYHLRSTVIRSSAPDTVPAIDPAAVATGQVLTNTETSATGVVHVSGSSPGDITFEIKRTSIAKPTEPTITRTTSGGTVKYVFTATERKPATGPPKRRQLPLTTLLTGTVTGPGATVSGLTAINAAHANEELAGQRKQLLECLRQQSLITPKEASGLSDLADKVRDLSALNSVLGTPELRQALQGAGAAQALAGTQIRGAIAQAAGSFDTKMGAITKRLLDDAPNAKTVSDLCSSCHKTKQRQVATAASPPLGGVSSCPIPPTPPPDDTNIEVRQSGDPNEKVGPSGSGKKHFIAPDLPLGYDVMFENVPTATAPAHEVTITDQLDPAKVDVSTLSLGAVYFGDTIATPPAGAQTWHGTVDLRPTKSLIVAIDASLDTATGLVTWKFAGLDPATGELETDPDVGFLPPDKVPPQGQGGVSFTVSPQPGRKTGEQISNGATIVFDKNAPISTPIFTNTIDASSPSSRIRSAKPKGGSCRSLKVAWAGKDTGSGVAYHDIYVARNAGSYQLWRYHSKRRSAAYRALADGAYAFLSVATDRAGHAEPAASRVWDKLVRSAVKQGRKLVLRLRPGAAKKFHITSLRVLADGRKKASPKRLPATIKLSGLKLSGHTITFVAKTRTGKKRGTLRAARTIAMCPAARKKR